MAEPGPGPACTATADWLALDPATLRAPWGMYDRWRALGRVAAPEGLGGWVVTDVALAQSVLRDVGAWSSASVEGPVHPDRDRWLGELAGELPALEELLRVPLQSLLAIDPPDHTRMRRVLVPWFSAAQIRRLEPLVDELVAELVGALTTGESVEAVSAFAHELPLRVIATLLGLPRPRWHELGEVAMRASTSNPHLEDKAALRARVEAELTLMRFFLELLEAPDPGLDVHGLLSGLRAAIDDGTLTPREATGLCRELLVAGADSTVNHLGSALLLLARDPALLSRLRAEPDRIGVFVEEALRLEPPFPGFWRRARTATRLGDVELAAGALLLVPFAALNRDPDAFPNPDAVDLDRRAPRTHLSFGHGLHFCLGAPLVRLQSLATFRALIPRVEAIELLCGPEELEPVPSVQDRGVLSLPLRCRPRAAGAGAGA
jgi:cytochrome P450